MLLSSCCRLQRKPRLLEATPSAGHARYKRAALTVVVRCHRVAAAAPSDAAAAATLAAAQAVAALFAQ